MPLKQSRGIFALAFGSLTIALTAAAQAPAELKIIGDWEIEVKVGTSSSRLKVPPPKILSITDEKYDSLPVFNPKAGGWAKGAQLRPLKAQETTTPFLLDPETVVLRSVSGVEGATLRRGQDYEMDPSWGTIGRLAGGSIKEAQPVYLTYRHALLRLDAIVLGRDGRITVREGEPRAAAPLPVRVDSGERHLANIWLPGRVAKLAPEHLFPITETAYPEPKKPNPTLAEKLVPKALAKLRSGEKLRILAWGDSVTVGTYLPNPDRERWQEQFVTRLRARFPRANLELLTEAWGGRNTGTYLAEPPGSLHNYQEKVLATKPDLIISEFVNDAGLTPDKVEERYSKLLADFQGIGAEWIILTPHYTRPDWMNLTRERDVDDDPRPYVAGLRTFAAKHNVALADAAKRYGRLWRQGIPHSTIMLNSINHPDARGMKIFADSLMEIFP